MSSIVKRRSTFFFLRTSESLCATCTTFPSPTFPLYASFANVAVLFPGTYFGQFGAGATAGFFTKLATSLCIVWESSASGCVAVERLKVPNISGTGTQSAVHWQSMVRNKGERSEVCHAPASGKSWRSAKTAPMYPGAVSREGCGGAVRHTVGIPIYINHSRTHGAPGPELCRTLYR